MQLKDRVGHWCCGTFLFRAEVLHNIPLSILRRAGYKKNKWFSARSEERDSVKYFKPHALFHICFYTSMNLLLFCFCQHSQGHDIGCRWQRACQVHLYLMIGTLSQSQPKSGSITVVALAPF